MNSTAENLEAIHQLLVHLRAIVGHRDRSGLDGAFLLAARAIFALDSGIVLRIRRHKDTLVTIPSARIEGDDIKSLGSHHFPGSAGTPLDQNSDYWHSCQTDEKSCIIQNGIYRHIIPIYRYGVPYALLELDRNQPFSPEETSLLDQLLGLFVDHLNLIDYAETDTLTGLLNRKTFDENLARLLSNIETNDGLPGGEHPLRRSHKEGSSNWLAVADIDHFKNINDTFGHIIGDEVLILVARLMRETFRFDDQLFRFGGEEFVIILQSTTQNDSLAALERFRRTVEQHDFPMIGHVTISLGATLVDAMDTPTQLVGRADQALYCAKESGRNRVESYELLHEAGRIQDPIAEKPKPELF